MSYSTPDVYHQPEHFDLFILKETDDGASYEFDKTVLFNLLGLSAWLVDNSVEQHSRIIIIEAAMEAGLR